MAAAKKPVNAEPKKAGRPKKPITAKQVESLAGLGCSNAEIAAVLDCSPDTIERNFAVAIKKGREEMRKSLRKFQFDSAKKGSVAMQIWLGKQYLGQADKIENSNIDVSRLSDEQLAALASGKGASGTGTQTTAEGEFIN